MHRPYLAPILCVFLALAASASDSIPTSQPNDNRVPAGHVTQGVLSLQLDLVEANWYPEKEGGPHLKVYAFAEKGGAPLIPGPLIRVPQGTEVRIELHNALATGMFVRGLDAHNSANAEPTTLVAGATANLHFTAAVPGTYYYSARSTRDSIEDLGNLNSTSSLPMGEGPFGVESELEGALIVDPPGAATDDRVFVITNWISGVVTPPFREVLAINGKSWPYTERLSAQVGNTANWRIINTSVSDHAMHLHGFFFRVKSKGSQEQDHLYQTDETIQAVTQYMPPGGTAAIAWTPERPGRWLLHCHMTGHMSTNTLSPFFTADAHPSEHDMSGEFGGMGSLVLGINVAAAAHLVAVAQTDAVPRKLTLLVRENPASRYSLTHLGYQIQESGAKEAPDPPPFPGAPLVLMRGEPVEITVVNQLKQPTAVHWHGIELESYYDGVPGWGGDALQTTPPIPPGGTFVARMTPPRAGTFIYHTHWHDVSQLTSGLYGPLIVLEPGQKFDPAVDKIFLISRDMPDEIPASSLILNGSPQPPPSVLKVGTKYRFRFINIGTNDVDARVRLMAGDQPATWKMVGKDGWTVPAAQVKAQQAYQPVSVGETYDFEFTPEKTGDMTLEVTLTFNRTKLTQLISVQ